MHPANPLSIIEASRVYLKRTVTKPSKTIHALSIRGARDNNLKNVSLDIPHDTLVAVTGLSGSGKSSLAFDTVYAEGQRRYVETFSPYTRQFFDKVKKPAVDAIEQVRPAVAIQQRTRITNSRSTVGTMTDVNDFLKVLWANAAEPVCPTCGIMLEKWDAVTLAGHVVAFQEQKRIEILLIAAEFVVRDPAFLVHEIDRLSTLGYSRWWNPDTGTIDELDTVPAHFANLRKLAPPTPKGKLKRNSGKATPRPTTISPEAVNITLVLDRLRLGAPNKKRLVDSLEQAFTLGAGSCLVIDPRPRSGRPYLQVLQQGLQRNQRPARFQSWQFRNTFGCPANSVVIPPPRPALFSFNHPLGACEECRGFGRILTISRSKCVPDPQLSIEDGALECWKGDRARREMRQLLKFCERKDIDPSIPWTQLTAQQQDSIFTHRSREFHGVLAWFKRVERKAYKMHVRVFLSRYREHTVCPSCRGTRLKAAALAYQIEGQTLPDIWRMPIGDLANWMSTLQRTLEATQRLPRPLHEVMQSILSRLNYLCDLGLPYLTLDRQARTLSGGETQRVNLVTALGSELISTQFVLDEPSVGLHARDTERLNRAIRALADRGNSVLVVEHDLECIHAADHVIELGPLAGSAGGEVVFNGALSKWPGVEVPAPRPDLTPRSESGGPSAKRLTIRGAQARNLRNLDVEIPLQRFVCLTGVSGSGKSTLVSEVITRAYEYQKHPVGEAPAVREVRGFEQLEDVVLVDQSPLAKSPRANIATYSGIWDSIRSKLAATEGAVLRKLTKSSFSFNVSGGRCPACEGAGFMREDMQFLSDVFIQCELCLGKRFQESVLEVRLQGKSVHDLLQMSVEECVTFFENTPAVRSIAQVLSLLGLGHLSLGHSLSELSGGEAQRLKLVPFVAGEAAGNSLLIFDEPTTGLHTHDVTRLIKLFQQLCARGHSVLCIEHNLYLVSECDWIVDLGPEGGAGGGLLLGQGSPRDFSAPGAFPESLTARYLREFSGRFHGRRNSAVKPLPPKKPRNDRQHLRIVGAREHNLKNIDVSVPLRKVVALTGLSGSGKSSIAKDIIYAEGQRRYLDCLSPYARQFIRELKKPDIDSISNIQPTICVYQHTFQPSRLSTVATMSEVYNFLRLLFAKIGSQACPDHPDHPIASLSPQEIAAEIRTLGNAHVRILAPVISSKKGTHKSVFERVLQSEIDEVRVDGRFGSPRSFEEGLEKAKVHSIAFVLAKLRPGNVDRALLDEVTQQALSVGGGTLLVHHGEKDLVFSLDRTCPICKRGFFRPDPEDLSFNSRRGRCQRCDGTGFVKQGAACSECGGSRLGPVGRSITLRQLNISHLCQKSAAELRQFLITLALPTSHRTLAEPILIELLARLDALISFGLDYLALARDCATLSGGELQRLRLAAAMGSPLSGVLYVFDEPSAGLHPLDNSKILGKFHTLAERGNSVLMIEHDAQSILCADEVIEVGPGAGRYGGTITAQGSPKDLLARKDSLTARWIAAPFEPEPRAPRAASNLSHTLMIKGGARNNISGLTLSLPMHALVTVIGVSGAGKSSLVHGIIRRTMTEGREELNAQKKPTRWNLEKCQIESSEPIERLLVVDQNPIGVNSRSTPASYLGIWDDVRTLFANSIEAKSRGWTPGYFSYNTGKGRCAECGGAGQVKLEMSFLPDAAVPCNSCNGSRYSDAAKNIRYLGLTISDALALTFDEAKGIFANHDYIHRVLHRACELGLGYLTLGQSSTTLSGGESQRIKLVLELAANRRNHTLYILDEPTTGLHRADVAKLLKVLNDLVGLGNTVLVIEHDPDVILASDYIVELGPGPGVVGGKVIFKGPPGRLAEEETPWGRVLRGERTRPEKALFSAQ